MNHNNSLLKGIIETLALESAAIQDQIKYVNGNFGSLVTAILSSKGKVVVTGIGKSGIIGKKISATLASTGTPSFFLHPAEGFHGDLGMIGPDDVILALSNSGETEEILKIVPFIKSNNNPLFSITGDEYSTLAKNSDIHIKIYITKEACPLNMAPTTSTTVMLAVGDAIAVSLMNQRNFQSEDYARFHPGGSLGKRLLTRISDVMRTSDLPIISPSTTVTDTLFEVSKGRLGIAIIMENNNILGIITDGDIRRAIQKYGQELFDYTAETIMTRNPKTINWDQKIYEAEELLRTNKIHSLLVLDEHHELAGIVDVFNLHV